ncbi:cysteine hydrolase family protein [Virgibacillus salexigens]|uniref:Isochorismatase family protein YecD n=2 Tax=Virgibacillus TaxID=84406 RepID=A0A024QEU1_9BACI|nr:MULTISPECIES: isochorismatase family cysteine hydrolase [Virgibacillus]MYL43230.1 isochorismatase family protein [Virgibacillus massiliensis]GGJ66600.1 putative isochorismatase family protein PncA [Virgibacillus kapii]CDQ40989.1 Isochorismatase family protein YecD [Virgibacillus massiliensis]
MRKALINVDYTNDFVADDGKLTCGKPGQAIETSIVNYTTNFIQQGEFVVFAIDTHVEGDNYHPESSLFPAHNIRGTSGRNLYGKLAKVYQEHQDKENVYFLDKTRYSAFQGTDLEMKLRERDITEIHLVGVCTDICILHTAMDAFNKGFNIIVYEDAVASFNHTGHEWALAHFEKTLAAKVLSRGDCD